MVTCMHSCAVCAHSISQGVQHTTGILVNLVLQAVERLKILCRGGFRIL